MDFDAVKRNPRAALDYAQDRMSQEQFDYCEGKENKDIHI